jgi:hypothetical protein
MKYFRWRTQMASLDEIQAICVVKERPWDDYHRWQMNAHVEIMYFGSVPTKINLDCRSDKEAAEVFELLWERLKP